ncbi:cell wall hydrolase [Terasakiella sp. A23]|uniref:cell wall hydrolase n=1 Tax=Terasakiella sp. FCG-A23 TaxID=3080561 RepID=UPI002955DB62|nr:cell wall hydrolase [Terasakiella sp. A23]MDV7338927.1 cell wall hydrolase [Terasakiella sp. A23]
MSSSNQTVRPLWARLLPITFISFAVFFGTTGFKSVEPAEKTSTYVEPSAQAFAREFNSFMSHNLIVETEQTRCLALNIYWEARSEPLAGQLAVAGVTMNRVADEKFPNNICNVVKQSKSKQRLHRCQFSWWCDGKKDDPKELTAWRNAQQVARLFLAGIYEDPTQEAKWYHADYVNPDWASRLKRTAKIGRHIFYTEQDTKTAQLSLK